MSSKSLVSRHLGWYITLVILFIAASGLISAQSSANLQGTVTDATGAVLPGAAIAVRNVATGEERTVQSDSAGMYLAASLPVGTYNVSVTARGMQNMVAKNLPLQVGQTVQENFTMRVASSSEIVEVTG